MGTSGIIKVVDEHVGSALWMTLSILQRSRKQEASRRACVASFLFLVSCFMLLASSLSAGEVTIVDENNRTLGTVTLRTIKTVPYLRARDVVSVFGGSLSQVEAPEKLVLSLGAYRLILAAGSRAVGLDGKALMMPVAARAIAGALYVPALPFIQILNRLVSAKQITWDASKQKISIEPARVTAKPTGLHSPQGVQRGVEGKRDTVVSRSSSQGVQRTQGEGKRERDTVVRGVGQGNRSGQSPKRSQKGWGSAEEGIDTVVIDHSTQGNSRVERPARPTVVGRAQKETEWMIDTVVIDPGHGGQDAGAIGPTGLKEKDVALDIAKRLAKSLSKELGIKAVLTRTSDVFVGLKERSRVASKKAGGKLFISIHCNASRDPYAEGCEVYFLSEAKTDDAREVAMRENASFVVEMKGREKNRDLSALVGEILLGMESDQYLRESQDLAAMVVGEVVRQTPLASRGVKQAGFYVMKGTLATMPSILVETAFISNPKEERLLKDPDFREQFISSVTRAVGLFKQKYENGLAHR